MTESFLTNEGGGSTALANLIYLTRRARHAASIEALAFIAVNETHLLTAYRQAALWIETSGLVALSGVTAVETNAPYCQWLQRVVTEICRTASADFGTVRFSAAELTPELGSEWGEWLPSHALYLPLTGGFAGGLLLAREAQWTDEEIGLLTEWIDAWTASWALRHKPTAWQALRAWLTELRSLRPNEVFREWITLARAGAWRELWQRKGLRWSLLSVAICLLPVRLTVLAPGELVPANPAVVRAPMEGIIDRVLVQPNQTVKAGTPLFDFDQTALGGRIAVAEQGQATVEAEYRQAAQQALFDSKSKAQLSLVQGRLAEKKAEAEYLRELQNRAGVVAPQDGIVMFGDVSEWVGRPVTTGERVMVVAAETDSEVEAWLSPGDMIDLPTDAAVKLYLNTSPFSPVSATLRYVAHSAQQRPDGTFAYRLRARIDEGESKPRVGLKGSAKVAGHRVPLIYWILRKPLATLRVMAGF